MKIALDVAVRPATAADLQDLEWYGHQARLRRHIADILDRRAAGETELLVADANGFAVGRLGIDFVRLADAALLWSFAVIPHLQGLGIGTAMLAEADRMSRERGFETVEIRVEKDNPRARRLYERRGFAIVGEATGPAPPEWILRKTV
jgi:ribosomal protein S18 acetylase RimI-like enzyme